MDAGTIEERTRTFDIRAYQDDDCPLCLYQRVQGGIFVFARPVSAEDEVEDADGDSSDDEHRPSALVEKFALALDRLDMSADELISALEPLASAELLQLAVNDVGWLHDRLFDLAWSEDREGRAAQLERAFASGLSTVETIAIAHPELGDPCTRTGDALEAVRRAFADE